MKQYIIERFFPGAGKLTHKVFQEIANNPSDILRDMGSGIEQINTYIRKVGCIACLKLIMKICCESISDTEVSI